MFETNEEVIRLVKSESRELIRQRYSNVIPSVCGMHTELQRALARQSKLEVFDRPGVLKESHLIVFQAIMRR
jgi:hypothetical protein